MGSEACGPAGWHHCRRARLLYDSWPSDQSINSEGRAFVINQTRKTAPIFGHKWAKTPVDGIHQGADMTMRFICEEQTAGPLRAFWPWSPTATASYTFADFGRLGTIGVIDTTTAKNIVLTAIAGTSAATNGPSTLTALVIPTEQTQEMVMDTSLRKFPIELRLLLQDYTAVERFFSST